MNIKDIKTGKDWTEAQRACYTQEEERLNIEADKLSYLSMVQIKKAKQEWTDRTSN